MPGDNLTGQFVSETYQRLLQLSENGKSITDGTGSIIGILPVSTSYSETASYALNGNIQIDSSSLVSNSTFNSFTSSIQNQANSLTNATSSYVLNSQTSSFVQNNQTSSFVLNSQTSSFVTNSQTSSFVNINQTSSFTLTSSFNTFTSSIQSQVNSLISATSSYVVNSQTSSFIQSNQTSSFVTNSQTSSMTVLSASFALTSSMPTRGIITASAVDTTITFTKGDGSTFNITLSQSGSVESASYASFAGTASYVLNAISSSFATTASYALNSQGSSSFPFTGSAVITGSLIVTGSIRGQVINITPSNQTASLNCSLGNMFTLTLSSSANTFLTASNIQPGQAINLRIVQPSPSGSLSYSSQFKFPSGFAYTASQAASVTDIMSFLTFDSSSLFGTSIRNFV